MLFISKRQPVCSFIFPGSYQYSFVILCNSFTLFLSFLLSSSFSVHESFFLLFSHLISEIFDDQLLIKPKVERKKKKTFVVGKPFVLFLVYCCRVRARSARERRMTCDIIERGRCWVKEIRKRNEWPKKTILKYDINTHKRSQIEGQTLKEKLYIIIIPCVANEDPVRRDHGKHLEDNMSPQVFCHRMRSNQEIDHPCRTRRKLITIYSVETVHHRTWDGTCLFIIRKCVQLKWHPKQKEHETGGIIPHMFWSLVFPFL